LKWSRSSRSQPQRHVGLEQQLGLPGQGDPIAQTGEGVAGRQQLEPTGEAGDDVGHHGHPRRCALVDDEQVLVALLDRASEGERDGGGGVDGTAQLQYVGLGELGGGADRLRRAALGAAGEVVVHGALAQQSERAGGHPDGQAGGALGRQHRGQHRQGGGGGDHRRGPGDVLQPAEQRRTRGRDEPRGVGQARQRGSGGRQGHRRGRRGHPRALVVHPRLRPPACCSVQRRSTGCGGERSPRLG